MRRAIGPQNRVGTGESGFTLAELAIVLLIVSVLLGGLLVPLSTQVDARNIGETEKTLAEIREALIGYAASHVATSTGRPYLPCPDTDNDGLEDPFGTSCGANVEGAIPWATLGIGEHDAWNNRFRYRVASAFTSRTNGFSLTAVGNLDVCVDKACSAKVAANVPAVILSHGRNGAGALRVGGGTNPLPDATTAPDENENADVDSIFVSRTPGTNFDDLVVWVSPHILFNRMIAAGRLP